MNEKIKILSITRSPINSNDNLGSTIEKILGQKEEIELFNIYLRSESYNNDVCKGVFQIPEQELLKSFFNKNEVGNELKISKKKLNYDTSNANEKNIYNFVKRIKLYTPWFIREILWSLGNWKTKKLIEFIKKTNPDFIFFVSFNSWYPYRVFDFVTKNLCAKTIIYHVDDNYSSNQVHFNPLYWIYHTKLRKIIRKYSHEASINYCISYQLKQKYDSYFNINCGILQKTAYFDDVENYYLINKPIKIVFTGNISSGRWKTLSKVGKALDEINKEFPKAYLEIYTQTYLSNKINKALKCDSIKKLESVSAEVISEIQKSADVLLHVESFSFNDRREVRLSFSTKIVDYVSRGRAILAIGPCEVASIRYFIDNKMGFVIFENKNIKTQLNDIICNPNNLSIMAKTIFEKGKNMHDTNIVLKKFINDLNNI